jgi:hypothetical protein
LTRQASCLLCLICSPYSLRSLYASFWASMCPE